MSQPEKFGDLNEIPFSEPAWYDGRNVSPYYNEGHVKWRAKMRAFVDEHIMDNVEEWEAGESTKTKLPNGLPAVALADEEGRGDVGFCAPDGHGRRRKRRMRRTVPALIAFGHLREINADYS